MTALMAATRRNYDSRVAMARELALHNAGVARAHCANEARRCQIYGQWRYVQTEEVGRARLGRVRLADCLTVYEACRPGPCRRRSCQRAYRLIVPSRTYYASRVQMARRVSAPGPSGGLLTGAVTADGGTGCPPARPAVAAKP